MVQGHGEYITGCLTIGFIKSAMNVYIQQMQEHLVVHLLEFFIGNADRVHCKKNLCRYFKKVQWLGTLLEHVEDQGYF